MLGWGQGAVQDCHVLPDQTGTNNSSWSRCMGTLNVTLKEETVAAKLEGSISCVSIIMFVCTPFFPNKLWPLSSSRCFHPDGDGVTISSVGLFPCSHFQINSHILSPMCPPTVNYYFDGKLRNKKSFTELLLWEIKIRMCHSCPDGLDSPLFLLKAADVL